MDGVVFGSLMLLRALAETGDRDRFDEVARRASSFCRARGDFYGGSQLAWVRAYFHWKQGDVAAALAAARESLDPRLPFDRLGHALILDILAWIAASREHEIATFLGQGLGSREIADRLSLSPRTVEGHISSAMARLGMRSRAQLAAWAVRP